MAKVELYTTTDRLLHIHWARHADPTKRRRQRWGGLISHWEFTRLREDVYRISRNVPIATIEAALKEVLRDSDSAILVYPFGKTKQRSSAMRIRVFNG